MKNTLLLAALVAFVGVSAASAGESKESPRKASQPQFVRAEARALGGRADRAVIVTSTQASVRKAKGHQRKDPFR